MLQMLHCQNLMTLCYLFLTSTLQKMKYIRSNNCNFITNELRKAITNRSKLRNKFLKTRNEESRRRFNRQRNFCVSLLHKTKRRFFGKLNHKVVSNNRKFFDIIECDVANYGDDNAPYNFDFNVDNVISNLKTLY